MLLTGEDLQNIKEVIKEEVNQSEERLRTEITNSEGRLRDEINQSNENLMSEIKQSEERLRVEITDKLTKEIAKSELRITDHTSKEIEMNHALAADLLFENFPNREEVRIMIENSRGSVNDDN